jgi:Bacterial SH3 domain
MVSSFQFQVASSEVKMNRRPRPWPLFLALAMLLFAMLACGGFQVRVTPTPKPTATATESKAAATSPATQATAAAPKVEATASPTATTAPSPAAAPAGLASGAKARVAAGGGLNIRDRASAKGKQVGRLNANVVVTLLEGPTQAENLAWWKIDNGAGLVGWVATGPANDPWLVPAAPAAAATLAPNAPKLVDRPIKLGDRVQVTTSTDQWLTVRETAGKAARQMAKVKLGTLFTVRGGPIKQDGLTWWELEGETVKGWAAEGDGTDRWLTPLE